MQNTTPKSIHARSAGYFTYDSDHTAAYAESPPDKTKALLEILSRRVNPSDAPSEPEIRISLAGKPICSPGNLTSMIARAKVGKTAAEGAAIAAIVVSALGMRADDTDTFGFSAAPADGRAVVVLDTEQSTFDTHLCLKRALARAGAESSDLPWLHVYSLAGMPAKAIRASLPGLLEELSLAHEGIHSVFIDGIADLVDDPNDQKECNPLVAELHGLAIKHDCPIISVIHSNEGKASGDDGRGHLGKQLIRKSESNLVLSKEGEITIITSEKQRKAPITRADGIAFTWSDEYKRHVSCEVPGGGVAAKEDELVDLAVEVFKGVASLKFGELTTRIVAARRCSKNTAGRRITSMKLAGLISLTFGLYTLNK